MSLLFCHDHRFFVGADGKFYSYGQFDKTVLDRYVRIFGDVTIAARAQSLTGAEDISRLSLCSSDHVRLLQLPNLSSVRGLTVDRPRARALLDEAVRNHDAVIARLPSEIGLMALSAARRMGKPAGAEIVACVWDGLASHGSIASSAYAPVAWWRMRRAVARTPHVLYVTNAFLQHRYPSRGARAVASNVEIADSIPEVLEHRLAHISHARSPLTFGMIAALFHKEKGVDVALKAFAHARQTTPGIQLKILGPGDASPWLDMAHKLGIEKDVAFCGTLPRGEAVMRWLDEIDVYVQASFQEGLPRALIEAMSRGCPALASSVGGTPELLPATALHKPGDARTLARQMSETLSTDWQAREARRNFEASRSYGKNHLDRVREDFWRQLAV